jgi:hypothetical protein
MLVRLGGVFGCASIYVSWGLAVPPNHWPGEGKREQATATLEWEKVYIPHLRIEMWGTRGFGVGLEKQATARAV